MDSTRATPPPSRARVKGGTMEALARTTSAMERTRTASALAMAASLDHDTAQSTAELAAVRSAMLAARAAVNDASAKSMPLGLGDIEEVEVLVRICGFLTPQDLGRMACVSASFGVWRRARFGSTQLSVVEETARRWVVARPAAVQRSYRGLWLRRMHESQRPAAVFSRSHRDVELLRRGGVASCMQTAPRHLYTAVYERVPTFAVDSYGHRWGAGRTAASTVAMVGGQHYAAFKVALRAGSDTSICFGLVRHWGYDVERGVNAQDVDGHCFYSTGIGQRCPGWDDWEGMQGARQGDTIGLLLDLEAGTLTVFKNDTRLGVMATDLKAGWKGYCWAVSLNPGDSVCIESALMPAAAGGSGDSDG